MKTHHILEKFGSDIDKIDQNKWKSRFDSIIVFVFIGSLFMNPHVFGVRPADSLSLYKFVVVSDFVGMKPTIPWQLCSLFVPPVLAMMVFWHGLEDEVELRWMHSNLMANDGTVNSHDKFEAPVMLSKWTMALSEPLAATNLLGLDENWRWRNHNELDKL